VCREHKPIYVVGAQPFLRPEAAPIECACDRRGSFSVWQIEVGTTVLGLVKSAPAAANSFIASASALIGRITPKRISRGRTVMPNPLAGEVGASVTGKALWSPEIDVPTGRAPLFQSIKSHPSVKHSCGGAARRRPRDECFNETP
jgi:hypothetical protein